MAKKIRLDFSKTEERSGWNSRQIPEGLHKMKIDAVQETEAQDGTAMLVYALVPTDAKYKTRRFPYYCKLQQNQLWKLRDLLVAAGQSVPKKALQIDPGKVVGQVIAAEVEDDMYNGQTRSQVQGTYSLDILDEDGADDEVEDDEEGVDFDEISDEGIEEEDDLDEDIEEDLDDEDEFDDEDDLGEEDLDEDDLDDEELEDEDWDDEEDEEEEEPEPSPKRRPAKKAPAKAAPKRVVKRKR